MKKKKVLTHCQGYSLIPSIVSAMYKAGMRKEFVKQKTENDISQADLSGWFYIID